MATPKCRRSKRAIQLMSLQRAIHGAAEFKSIDSVRPVNMLISKGGARPLAPHGNFRNGVHESGDHATGRNQQYRPQH